MTNRVVENINKIREQIDNPKALIVAVSKNISCETAALALEAPGVELGENRVQEFLKKYEYFEGRAKIHLIGHLQRNKVKYIVGKVELIHSVDSIRLLDEIQRRSEQADVVTNVLLQIKLYEDDNKYGITPDEIEKMLRYNEKNPNVIIKGFMTMAPFTQDNELISSVFKQMHDIYVDMKKLKLYNTNIVHLSMGMSNDYILASREGSNILRIGSAIFKDTL